MKKTSDLLREELKLTGVKEFSELEWKKENINFLTNHHDSLHIMLTKIGKR